MPVTSHLTALAWWHQGDVWPTLAPALECPRYPWNQLEGSSCSPHPGRTDPWSHTGPLAQPLGSVLRPTNWAYETGGQDPSVWSTSLRSVPRLALGLGPYRHTARTGSIHHARAPTLLFPTLGRPLAKLGLAHYSDCIRHFCLLSGCSGHWYLFGFVPKLVLIYMVISSTIF